MPKIMRLSGIPMYTKVRMQSCKYAIVCLYIVMPNKIMASPHSGDLHSRHFGMPWILNKASPSSVHLDSK